MRVVRPQGLGEDVPHPGGLHHGPDAAARDHAGPGGRGPEQHPARTETPDHLVRNRALDDGNPHQALPRALHALADRLGNLAGLSEADAHGALTVTDDHQVR